MLVIGPGLARAKARGSKVRDCRPHLFWELAILHDPYLLFSRLSGPSPQEGVHAYVTIKGGSADDGGVPGTPVTLKDPLRGRWELVHHLEGSHGDRRALLQACLPPSVLPKMHLFFN